MHHHMQQLKLTVSLLIGSLNSDALGILKSIQYYHSPQQSDQVTPYDSDCMVNYK